MTHSRRSFFRGAAALGAVGLAACQGGRSPQGMPARTEVTSPPQSAPALPPISPELQLLRRATWGPTPGDLAQLGELGGDAWIERQLHPERIDDSAVQNEVAMRWPTLSRSACQLAQMGDEARIMRELREATIFRRVFSRRQLFEVVVDFWTDHFNVFHGDGLARHNRTAEDRDVIRRHALGSFRELLHASARSPSMLHYLDNRRSTKDAPNENYARELLELHTLGVDGGFTETDIQEVARAFTGWKIRHDQNDTLCLNDRHMGFHFRPAWHDTGVKHVLGRTLPADRGLEDGNEVLDLLAGHPDTRLHVATKLCRRFVADDPPPALIEAVAARWGRDGDIRAMLQTLLSSESFLTAGDRKLSRPQEFAIATVRALEPDMDTDLTLHDLLRMSSTFELANMLAISRVPDAEPLREDSLPDSDLTPSDEGPDVQGVLNRSGHVPFQWPAPDGYPDSETHWASANGLLERWKFAIRTAERSRDGRSNAEVLAGDARSPAAIVDALTGRLLMRSLAPAHRTRILTAVAAGADPQTPLPDGDTARAARQAMALLLISPYGQRR